MRPDYPKVHSTFEAKGFKNDCNVEYFVQDLTEDHFDEAFELIVKFLAPEETFQKAIKLMEKEFAREILKQYYEGVFKQNVSIACFESESLEMVGVSAMSIKFDSDSKVEVRNSNTNSAKYLQINLNFKFSIPTRI